MAANGQRQAPVEVPHTKVPTSARWLGGLGAVPFIGLAGMLPFLTGSPRIFISHALVAYGATILSFLGGVHWGLAIGSPDNSGREKLPARLILSVIPSLAGWAALLVADATGLLILALAIAMMLWVDLRATRLNEAPSWYPKLRIPLTCVVVATLVFGALA
jgi:predicted lysophospholipase L1 biosynthesis ABC-type transport system permease subunit